MLLLLSIHDQVRHLFLRFPKSLKLVCHEMVPYGNDDYPEAKSLITDHGMSHSQSFNLVHFNEKKRWRYIGGHVEPSLQQQTESLITGPCTHHGCHPFSKWQTKLRDIRHPVYLNHNQLNPSSLTTVRVVVANVPRVVDHGLMIAPSLGKILVIFGQLFRGDVRLAIWRVVDDHVLLRRRTSPGERENWRKLYICSFLYKILK